MDFVSELEIRKIATVEEVANAILILSSRKVSGHCTGTTMEIDGGKRSGDEV
jgi:NAD(P)-dependent dehydrogenase (short-subunit alcohol dehydrogenase family)